jgi:hypothetical protein
MEEAPLIMSGTAAEVGIEIDRQLEILVGLGYPGLARTPQSQFRDAVDALREPLEELVVGAPLTLTQRAAFVLVVNGALVPVTKRVPLLALGGRPGTLNQHFADVDTFRAQVDVPSAPVYAVLAVERGDEFLDARPSAAAPAIAERGRSMLTIEEGIAFLHASPGALEKNRCFHTGASRSSDPRVPALWISARAPHLGWCWENNHHSWLGVASCAVRVGPTGETSVTSGAAPSRT